MTKKLHTSHFPNESSAYREARDKLLEAEIALKRQTEEVAKLRRHLPLGGKIKEDYEFVEKGNKKIHLSELFDSNKDTLVVYNMMFAPDWDEPCNMCNSIVDGLNGNARQITQRVNLVIVAKAPIEKLLKYAKRMGWNHLRIISSEHNIFNQDYFAEINGEQMPMLNVFCKKQDSIYHTWGSELAFTSADQGQDQRVVDTIWPLWNILDLTPEGRGDWYPEI